MEKQILDYIWKWKDRVRTMYFEDTQRDDYSQTSCRNAGLSGAPEWL